MPRLYLQKGLSERVVSSIVRRLQEAIAMSNANGADSTAAEMRGRSRSRTRADAEGAVPAGATGPAEAASTPSVTTEIPMPAPGEAEAPLPEAVEVDTSEVPPNPELPGGGVVIDQNTPGVGHVLDASNQLAERLNKCMNQLQAVSFELSGTVDAFTDSQEKIREEIGKLCTKIEAQSNALLLRLVHPSRWKPTKSGSF